MGCKLTSIPMSRHGKLEESITDDSIKQASLDLMAFLSEAGDSRIDDYLNGYTDTIDDLDKVVRFITMYDEDIGMGFSSFESLMNTTHLEKSAYIGEIIRTISKVIEASPNPHVFGEMDEILDSGIALATVNEVLARTRSSRTAASQFAFTRGINKVLNLWDNPAASFQYWAPGKNALERLARLKEFSKSQLTVLNDKITDMLNYAEDIPVFHDNKIHRGQINKMITSLNGLDLSIGNDVIVLRNTLMNSHDIDEEIVDSVVEGLTEVKKMWNLINYGVSDLNSKEMPDIVREAGRGTIIGFYKELHERASDYYTYAKASIGDTETLDDVKNILDQTDITKMTRKHYVPTYDKDMFGDIETLEESSSRFFVPGMYRPKSFFGTPDEYIDFEKIIRSNLLANNYLFNKMQMAIAREHLDTEYKAGVLNGMLDDEYRGDALRAANLMVRKLDRYLEYDVNNRTDFVRLAKRIDAIGGAIVSGIIGGPGNAMNNIVAGRLYAAIAGINVGSASDYEALRARADAGERALLSVVDEVTQDLMSPGIASQFNEMPKDMLDLATAKVRKMGDWLGDGAWLSSWSYWKRNLTVKGTEETYLRQFLKNMVFAELYTKMKLTGLTPDNPRYAEVARSIAPDIARDAWMDLQQGLGHFDPLNKPIWAYIKFETAETASDVIAGMFLKYFYTFRHVTVTNCDLMLKRGRQLFGGTYDSRWDFTNNPNKPHEFHTGGVVKNPNVAFGAATALAVFSLARHYFRNKKREYDPEESDLQRAVDVASRFHIPVIDSANPIQGIDDLALFLVFSSGLARVDEDTYNRYKASAINTSLGMAGGRFAAAFTEDDRNYIEGLTNMVSGESDWIKTLSDEVIDTGMYGENLRAISREFRRDTALLRQPWAVDILLSTMEGLTLSGAIKPVSDKKQAQLFSQEMWRKDVARWSRLAYWMDSWDYEDADMKKKYTSRGLQNKYLNGVSHRRYSSAARYLPPEYQRNYHHYAKRTHVPYMPRPVKKASYRR